MQATAPFFRDWPILVCSSILSSRFSAALSNTRSEAFYAISPHGVVSSNKMIGDAVCFHRLASLYGSLLRLLLVSAYHIHRGIPERRKDSRNICAHGPIGSHHSDGFNTHTLIVKKLLLYLSQLCPLNNSIVACPASLISALFRTFKIVVQITCKSTHNVQ